MGLYESSVLYAIKGYAASGSSEEETVGSIMAKRTKEEINQTLKRLAKEARERMESAGLKMYVWETCGGERVRACSKKLDVKLCLWSDPTVYSRNKGKDWIPRPKGAILKHPGEMDGCRCTAVAYWPELMGEI